MSKRTAFISFDGLSDPLGQSQILPYIIGLAGMGYNITVFSCEKPNRLTREKKAIDSELAKVGIRWQYLLYDEKGNWLTRWIYTRQLKSMLFKEHKKQSFALVHCRSYLAAIVALKLKRRYDVPYLFDMRGFWADERIDGGIWKLSKPFDRFLFHYFKHVEKQLLQHADAINSLTESARKELNRKFSSYNLDSKIILIPCCTNTQLFNPETTQSIAVPSFPSGAPYLVYAGSIGTWYFTNEVLDCFIVWKKKLPHLHLLLLTKDLASAHKVMERLSPEIKNCISVIESAHKDVARYLKDALASIFFIMPAYSKIASSPTKMAECWAMNLPIITNSGIGDNDLYFRNGQGGVLISAFTDSAYDEACTQFLAQKYNKTALRAIAVKSFDHKIAIENYSKTYERISNGTSGS